MKLIQNIEKIDTRSKFVLILVLICIDQFFKYLSINIFETFVLNNGISFGLLANNEISLLLALIALLGITWILLKSHLNIFYWLILGGGISNLIDRLFVGAVVDYINFFNLIWFNLADVFINIGIICVLINIFFDYFKVNDRNFSESE